MVFGVCSMACGFAENGACLITPRPRRESKGRETAVRWPPGRAFGYGRVVWTTVSVRPSAKISLP